jgi:hypothetical protein
MSASQMRVEDRLAGASNWSPWKARMIFILEDLELWDIVEAVVPPVIAQFVARSNGYKIEVQTGVTGTYPTQCHLDGKVLSH